MTESNTIHIIPQLKRKIVTNHTLVFGSMYFKIFDSSADYIVNHYSERDWHNIFGRFTEEDVIDLASCVNTLILIWCDQKNDNQLGMLYLEEPRNKQYEITLHGGTWDHSPKYYWEIFRTMTGIIKLLILCGTNKIKTTCSIKNKRADRFQNSLGFKEVARQDMIIYKELDYSEFNRTIFAQRFL